MATTSKCFGISILCVIMSIGATINMPGYAQQTVTLLQLDSGPGKLNRDFKPPWSQFPYWTFSYCLNGQGRIDFQKTGISFFSRKGHVSIAPANRIHRGTVISKRPGTYYWIHAQFEILGFRDPLAYLALPNVLPRGISLDILEIGRNIVQITGNKNTPAIDTAINLYYQGIRLLKLLTDNFKWTDFSESPPAELEALTPVIEAMKLNIGRRVDMRTLARSASMSLPTFYRHFKRTFKITAYAFVEKLRMREAATLLCRKDVSIDTLANDLGYCDRSQFSKSFKRFYGQGPAQYRRNYYSLFSSEYPPGRNKVIPDFNT